MASAFYLIKREDFEAWVALLDAKITVHPDTFKSLVRVEGRHANGTRFQFETAGVKTLANDAFVFGRNDDWNAVKVNDNCRSPFNHYKEGARDPASWKAADEAVELLVQGHKLLVTK
jgi:hypothetical protein